MSASDYPVTFGYRATDGIFYGPSAAGKPTYVGPYHRGKDRAMPVGTEVVIGNTPIALSGNSGSASSGAHLHIGAFIGGNDVDPTPYEFQPGTVTEVNQDSVNGLYVRIQVGPASVVYLHLSKALVTKGQVIQQGVTQMVVPDADNWFARINKLMVQIRGREIGREEFRKYIVGQEPFHAVEIISDSPESDSATDAQNIGFIARRDNWQGQIATLSQQVKDMDGDKQAWVARATTAEDGLAQSMKAYDAAQKEIKDLKAQLAVQSDDTKLLNSFGEVLQKLIARIGMKRP